MPRFTYKDWVGRRATVVSSLTTKDGTLRYDPGDIVQVTGYDSYLRFGITNLEGRDYIWGVEPKKLKLHDAPPTIREKVVAYLIRANLHEKTWVGAPEIARQVNEKLASVSGILHTMYSEGALDKASGNIALDRAKGKGTRGGLGYSVTYSTNPSVLAPSRYDRLMSERDNLSDP